MRNSFNWGFALSFAGKLVYALASFVQIPLFSHLLGRESVGLVGFFSSLQVVIMLLEAGMSSALIRQIALHKGSFRKGRARGVRYLDSLLISNLIAASVLGMLIALILHGLSPILASQWLTSSQLPVTELSGAIALMGAFIGLNFPVFLLQAALQGHERHLALNALYIVYSLVRVFGVAFYIWLSDGGIVDLFLGFLLVQLAYLVMLLLVYFWRPQPFFGLRPGAAYLQRSLAFSVKVLALSASSAVILQYDKLYLSAVLPLAEFSDYAVASALAGGAYIFSSALQAVLFPRFSMLMAQGDSREISRIFVISVWGGALLVTSLAGWSAFHMAIPLRMILPSDLAAPVGGLFPVLFLGSLLQSVQCIPFAMLLASGRLHFVSVMNWVAVPLLLLAVPLLYGWQGVPGVAWVWLVYNLCTLVLLYRYVLSSDLIIWRYRIQGAGWLLLFTLGSLLVSGLFSLYDLAPLGEMGALLMAALPLLLMGGMAVLMTVFVHKKGYLQ